MSRHQIYTAGSYNELPLTEHGEFCCVSCGMEQTHLIRVSPLFTDSDRPYVLLWFECEGCDVGTEWRIGNHKGNTSATANEVSLSWIYAERYTGPFK